MAVGAGKVLGPESEAFAEIAIEAAAVTIVPTAGKHEPGEGKFRLLLPVGRPFELKVLHAWEFAEGALKRTQYSDEQEPEPQTTEKHAPSSGG
jgi:hypothetical protein